MLKEYLQGLGVGIVAGSLSTLVYFNRQVKEMELTISKQSHLLETVNRTEDNATKEVTETHIKPDGSRIIRKEKTENKSKVFSKIADKKDVESVKQTTREVTVPKYSRYSLGVQYPVNKDSIINPDWRDLGITAGMRIGPTPIRIEADFWPKRREITLGLEIDL